MKYLPFSPPKISRAGIKAVSRSLRTGWIGTGPIAKEFEQSLAEYTGVAHSAAVSSCTSGLFLVMKAIGLGAGDEVITTAMTFASTVNSILHCGATPLLADIDPATGNIDLESVEKLITPATRVLLPVHYAGYPCDLTGLRKLADKHKLFLLEDCAHAVESTHSGKRTGSVGDAAVFSFYATKNIAIGEGGMVVSNDPALIDKVARLSLHGLSRGAWSRFSQTGKRTYDVDLIGYKANLTDVQAAIGISQLNEIESNYRIRERLWDFYDSRLQTLPILLPPVPGAKQDTHARHLYVIRLQEGRDRDALVEKMSTDYGLAFGVHYKAIPQFKIYRELLGVKEGQFPNAESWGRNCISLSLSPGTTMSHAKRVAAALVEELK